MFVALLPPVEVVEDLETFLEPRRATSGPRWSDPGQWHVTLAFMAAVPDRAVEPLLEEVTTAAAAHGAMTLSVTGGGCFPDVTRARVLWAGLEGDPAVTALARSVRSACAVAGASPAGGAVRPHVTLARFARPVEASRWLRVLETYRGPSWTADEVVVVQSHLAREPGHRPRHEVLARAPLRG